MKTLFKKALELSSEGDTEVYLVAFRRGRFHEFNSMPKTANRALFPPAPSIVVRAKHNPMPCLLYRLTQLSLGSFLPPLLAQKRWGNLEDTGRNTAEGYRVMRGVRTVPPETGMSRVLMKRRRRPTS